jgi:CheY-like chemotaxis protein
MRILVVEDDARMADLLKRGLTQDCHFVQVAGDGPTGLEKARSRHHRAGRHAPGFGWIGSSPEATQRRNPNAYPDADRAR